MMLYSVNPCWYRLTLPPLHLYVHIRWEDVYERTFCANNIYVHNEPLLIISPSFQCVHICGHSQRETLISENGPRGRIQIKTWCMEPFAKLTTINSPNVHYRFDSNTFAMGNPMTESTLTPYARVDLNPMPESTLSPCQGLWIWPLYVAIPRVKHWY